MVVTGLSSLSLHEAKATAATNKNNIAFLIFIIGFDKIGVAHNSAKNTAIIFVFIFIIFYNDFGCKIMKNLQALQIIAV